MSTKNILVTGACGFIGSNFVNQYMQKYPESKIVNVDAMYYCASLKNILPKIRENKNYKFIEANITNTPFLTNLIQKENIDHVIHFAAQSHVQNSFTDSLQYTYDNVLGTHSLLEACRKNKNQIKKIIHVSTDEVYGETNDDKKTESSLLCPTNPYAASKAAAEMMVNSYRHSFGLPIIITRGNNVYGPNQYPEKLIPKFIKLLLNNEKVTIQGDGSHLRSFLYVTDVVDAFEIILEKGIVGEIYNIGSEKEYTVNEVAKILIQKIKNNIEEFVIYIEDRPFNDKRYFICSDKLRNLGWNPKVDFLEGIDKTIEHYRQSD